MNANVPRKQNCRCAGRQSRRSELSWLREETYESQGDWRLVRRPVQPHQSSELERVRFATLSIIYTPNAVGQNGLQGIAEMAKGGVEMTHLDGNFIGVNDVN